MAKKKAAGGVSMAQEIRNLLTANRRMEFKDVYAALVKKFPSRKINRNSSSVAFYNAREKLGIPSSRPGKKKRKKSAGKKVVVKRTPASARQAVDIATLQAAAKFVSEIGDAAAAIEAIRQLKSLQID